MKAGEIDSKSGLKKIMKSAYTILLDGPAQNFTNQASVKLGMVLVFNFSCD